MSGNSLDSTLQTSPWGPELTRCQPSGLLGNSPAIRAVYHLIEKAAKTRATVLISGESGVGKDLVAWAIHSADGPAGRPFIRSAGADFPEGWDGTLFIDDVGELPWAVQTKLLRLLQERIYDRTGGRIVATTGKNLEALVSTGRFREDLYYRLNAYPIVVPPLRDRGADVVTLADEFVVSAARRLGKPVRGLSSQTLQLLMGYPWPGNVRELENCMDRAVLLADGEFIHSHHLPPSLHSSVAPREVPSPPPVSGLSPGTTLEEHLASIERAFLVRTLEETRGNMAEAARRLGLTKRMMLLRMHKFALEYQTFRRHRQ